jgi:hypothetical protein
MIVMTTNNSTSVNPRCLTRPEDIRSLLQETETTERRDDGSRPVSTANDKPMQADLPEDCLDDSGKSISQ